MPVIPILRGRVIFFASLKIGLDGSRLLYFDYGVTATDAFTPCTQSRGRKILDQ
jgi:hypothetical protein